MLIGFYGQDISLTYPKDKSKPQMFFSSSICRTSIVEMLRDKNPIVECAQNLRKECENYCFNLDDSNCNPRYVAYSLNQYKNDKLPIRETLFDNLFLRRNRYGNIIRKCDTIFQIVCKMVHNGRKKVPIYIGISQSIHEEYRSKQLIQVFNRLGLCISYDELERIDSSLANEIVHSCIENKVPLSQTITSASIIEGALVNFNHNENTLSGKRSSNVTIFMVFQNSNTSADTKNVL